MYHHSSHIMKKKADSERQAKSKAEEDSRIAEEKRIVAMKEADKVAGCQMDALKDEAKRRANGKADEVARGCEIAAQKVETDQISNFIAEKKLEQQKRNVLLRRKKSPNDWVNLRLRKNLELPKNNGRRLCDQLEQLKKNALQLKKTA